jgi:undecaprenyl-diphosphatase
MNFFDSSILIFLNGFARQSFIFDKTMAELVDIDLLKGGILMGFIWWHWFGKLNEKENQVIREHIIATLVGSFAALFTARILALTLPFRFRPLHRTDIDFVLPYTMEPEILTDWSAFPSDHAVLFFCLAFSFWYISKRLALFSIIYVAIVISFPRIYLGLHYPTDILAGAALGLAFAFTANRPIVRHTLSRPVFSLMYRLPGMFYFSFFLTSYQIAVLFNDVRKLGEKTFRLIFKYLLAVIS